MTVYVAKLRQFTFLDTVFDKPLIVDSKDLHALSSRHVKLQCSCHTYDVLV